MIRLGTQYMFAHNLLARWPPQPGVETVTLTAALIIGQE